tara:strand:+ start:2291 stop:2497 length:207 start_codon:yes stop_codon:yes gene_type:complete
MQKRLLDNREVILEFTQFGQFVKVSAMDVKTLTEISISGPSSTPQPLLEQNALKRLNYVLKKKGIIRE